MSKTLIIAEAGVNHNGSLEMARQLIDIAANAGADIVKFQTFKSEKVISKNAKQAEYQQQNTGVQESQLEMVKRLELNFQAHLALAEHCKSRNIEFWSTAFDSDSLQMLDKDFGFKTHKIPSGEITNAPFLLEVARCGKPVIMSTGMCTLGDVELALGVLAYGYINNQEPKSAQDFKEAYFSKVGRAAIGDKVTLLHCTTEYPAPFSDVNLLAMDTMKSAFGLPVGLSDHTDGIAIPIAAVARGASVIEKHFTIDKHLPGPDHKASLSPDELKCMVQAIRQVEAALGNGVKVPEISEVKNMAIARKSLVAAEEIMAGDVLTKSNLTVKRPGTGISPLCYWEYLGKKARVEYRVDEEI